MVNICIVSTVRAPESEMQQWANYHLNLGISAIFLFFDDPNDPFLKKANSFAGVVGIQCTDEHYKSLGTDRRAPLVERQLANCNRGLELARQSAYDWIIHIDSDELIYYEESFGEYFETIPKDETVIRFGMREAVPERIEYHTDFSSISLFKMPPSVKRKNLAINLGCGGAFYKGEYFRGHMASKSCTKVTPLVKAIGVHLPEFKDGKEVKVALSNELFLLHYDASDFTSWNEKWERRLDGTATSVVSRRNRKDQLRLYSDTLSRGEKTLKKLYKKMHFCNFYEKGLLGILGLLTRIELAPDLFERIEQKNPE